MGAVFALKGVSFAYKAGASALKEITVAIEQGERVAILGANGSGKSTLLLVLAGLISPTSGEVYAFGEPLSAERLSDEKRGRAFRRRVGLVFQNADAQLFSPSVREEIAFGPLHMGLSTEEVRQRVADTLALFGLEELADRAPYNLSGGEKKKVALASVLSMNPEVLLLDEPTAGLDPRTEYWLLEFLERLYQAGKTIIAATHHIGMLDLLADRAVVLSEAHRVVSDGPVSGVLADRELLLAANLIHPAFSYSVR